MTRAMFRKMIAQALTLLTVTLVVLLLMNLITNQRLEQEKQAGYQETLGVVLPAENYSEISLDLIAEKNPAIQHAYTAYGSEGIILGYVLEVKEETETGYILTRMSFSADGETLLALRVLDNGEQNNENTEVKTKEFYSQFENKRMPAALLSDLPEQDLTATQYPAITGLNDGVFREQQDNEDESGYKDYVELVVNGGRIVQVTWDATQTDGGTNRAKASVAGEFVLDDNSVIWAAQAYAMENKLIEVQDPAKIAIKSDGTTEVVEGVSVSVNAFVTLANKCIEDSKNGIPAVSATPTGAPQTEETEISQATLPAEETTASAQATPAATPVETPAATAAVTADAADSTSTEAAQVTGDSYTGSEDGIVKNDQGSLSDTIDGFPSAKIKTKIDEAEGAPQLSRTVVSSVNQAYTFLLQYLKGES